MERSQEHTEVSQVYRLAVNVHVVPGFELEARDLLFIALVKLLQLEGHPGADFLHVDPIVALSEDVAVVPEENVVSLVVEGHHPPAFELRVLREQGGQHAAHSHAHFGVEVVEDELWDVLGRQPMMLDVLLVLDTGDLEDREWPFQVPDQEFPPMAESHHNDMRVVEIPGVLVDIVQLHLVAGVEVDVVEHHHELLDHVVDLHGRLDRGGDEDLDWNRVVEDLIELVHLALLVLMLVLFPGHLLILDCLRLLSLALGQLLPLLPLLQLQHVAHEFALGGHFHSLHLVLDVARLHLECLVEGGDALGFGQITLRLGDPFTVIGPLLLHLVLLFAFLPHC